MTDDTDPERAAGILALAAILDSLPARNDKVRARPFHPNDRLRLAEQCWDRGVRPHPEQAVRFPIPGKQLVGVPAYMSLPLWVPADRYAKHLRDHPEEAAAAAPQGVTLDQLRRIFERVDPAAAARLPTLDDAELAAEREAYAARLGGPFAKFAAIGKQNRRMTGGES